jgi:moderate conductance mechanosensitive channel
VPATLLGSCDSKPGVACRLVWDLSHDSRAAVFTKEYLGAPLNVVLRVLFVVLLALICQALMHRLINRLTERAAYSLLPQFRHGVTGAFRGVPTRASMRRIGPGRLVRRQQPRLQPDSDGAVDSPPPGPELADSEEAKAAAAGLTDPDGQAGVNQAAAQAEAALVDERRKQRVRALGAILRSAASVTIFAIAGFVILGDLSINLAPLLASAGVVGVAIGFGAQSLVRDYLAGVFMLVEDQYGVGDVITIGDATGTVENVTLRITRVRDVNGVVWHIRNGGIEAVGNESQGWARAVVDFPVPYETDLPTINGLLTEVGDAMWNEPTWRSVMLEAPEVWGAQEISGSEVIMRIVVKTAPLRQWETEREMRARVKAALHQAGIPPVAAAD